jgi:L-malate glycosyltransferase
MLAGLLPALADRASAEVTCLLLNDGRLASELRNSGITTLVADEARLGFTAILRQLSSLLADLRPQVVHSHRQKENLLAVLATLPGRLRGMPAARIATVHGMPEPLPQKANLRRRCSYAANFMVLAHCFDAVVAVSEDMRRLLGERVSAKRLHCIHNGIRCNRDPKPMVAVPAGHQLQLLAMGRLVPVKRFERLQVIAKLLRSRGLPEVRITLAGEGPLKSDLQRTFSADHDHEPVRMIGFADDTELLLASADALLITSDHEGLPMVALEALRRGLPVFGFRVGGLPELEVAGAPVILASAGDCAALADAVVRFFARTHARNRWVPPEDWKFCIEASADAYASLYAAVRRMPAP